ncbi:hypothetical protein [Streptomyces flavofungini]|uniref:hypothetical protein n=1 Tax=Streptomyces flavofungini TaxID=68200 RepID=UPI0025AFA3CD|nr:hypothetical protein [Streptomyces flavofungini]WJV50922.1 hypothetical protein QUY26_38735 [Streptomyces flavofungini]
MKGPSQQSWPSYDDRAPSSSAATSPCAAGRGQRDFAAAFALVEESLSHLRPWEPWVAEHSEQPARDFLTRSESKWASGEGYHYAIAQDGTLVGMCQVNVVPTDVLCIERLRHLNGLPLSLDLPCLLLNVGGELLGRDLENTDVFRPLEALTGGPLGHAEVTPGGTGWPTRPSPPSPRRRPIPTRTSARTRPALDPEQGLPRFTFRAVVAPLARPCPAPLTRHRSRPSPPAGPMADHRSGRLLTGRQATAQAASIISKISSTAASGSAASRASA